MFGAKKVFQGEVNPLTGRAIFETCVMPTLLYGSENRYLTEALLDRLECFQVEIGRSLQWKLRWSRLCGTGAPITATAGIHTYAADRELRIPGRQCGSLWSYKSGVEWKYIGSRGEGNYRRRGPP